jgi:hypothetical protein
MACSTVLRILDRAGIKKRPRHALGRAQNIGVDIEAVIVVVTVLLVGDVRQAG